jgi:cyclopropane-fatty-acyl-phospholipid synthase
MLLTGRSIARNAAGAPARRLVLAALERLRAGRLVLRDASGKREFGDPRSELAATVEIADSRAYAWALRGSTGLGEGYVDGLWRTDDLVAAARIACRNLHALDRWHHRVHPVLRPLRRAASRVPRNTRRGARTNISAHYDLGNGLFESFLDTRLVYSCANFGEPGAGLDEAQLAKLERACEALSLTERDHLLEIGTGWGALARHAAATRGCRVTTTTISRQQHAYAAARIREAGLADRVEVLLCDYRDLPGRYDKLVSIEMIEAVGWQYLPRFFARCAELLHRHGAAFLQAIVIDDGLYELEKASRSFANKHVFPGGCLPSVEEIRRQVRERTDFRFARFDDITEHYPPTLAEWRRRFNAAWPRLRELGYDARFRRLWNVYLAFSEAGFRERRIGDVQMLLAKPRFGSAELQVALGDDPAVQRPLDERDPLLVLR